jgi:hypothetical protein
MLPVPKAIPKALSWAPPPLAAARKKGGRQITLPPRGYSVCELRT